ncbi:MAG: M28 family peptidase [Myxococcales bacterium]|nr:M28 family peptidase [Myxococcales bacterium]MDH5306714.1 M28 family peptidase [Myxococcales bacterium]MDH5565599.1 M28 family peptidase [Myxococcales bacterium]
MPLRSLLLLAFAVVACGGSSPPPAPLRPPDPETARFDAFSPARAWASLEALSAMGSRASGTRGARAAREMLRDRLAEASIESREIVTRVDLDGIEPIELTHIVADLPGDSAQLFVLVAPYDSSRFDDGEFVGANDDASGAALLLELARVFAAYPLPYATRVVFLDGEGRLGRGGEDLQNLRGLGSASFAELMDEAGELHAVRLLVSFNRVCDADLRIARDLGSHRIYREEFWKAAARLGYSDVFPPAARFESSPGGHEAFRARGLRAVLAIEGSGNGGEDVPSGYVDGEADDLAHCAPESLEKIGVVTLAALETIGTRLAKIDRFAQSPLLELENVDPAGDAGAASRGGADARAAGDAQDPREGVEPSGPAGPASD